MFECWNNNLERIFAIYFVAESAKSQAETIRRRLTSYGKHRTPCGIRMKACTGGERERTCYHDLVRQAHRAVNFCKLDGENKVMGKNVI